MNIHLEDLIRSRVGDVHVPLLIRDSVILSAKCFSVNRQNTGDAVELHLRMASRRKKEKHQASDDRV